MSRARDESQALIYESAWRQASGKRMTIAGRWGCFQAGAPAGLRVDGNSAWVFVINIAITLHAHLLTD